MTTYDFTEAAACLAAVLVRSGLNPDGASGLATAQATALARAQLVVVPYFRSPPTRDHDRHARALVTACLSGMDAAASDLLAEQGDPYSLVVMLTGMVAGLVHHVADTEQREPGDVWADACAVAETTGDGT